MHSRSIYLYAPQKKSGSRIVAMGIMEMLKTQVQDVAYFKPIITTDVSQDDDINFFKTYFSLKQPIQSAYGITESNFKNLIVSRSKESAYEEILERFLALGKEYDFILCQGISEEIFFGEDIDLEIAKNLPVSLVAILSAKGLESVENILEKISINMNIFINYNNMPIALFVNRIDKKLLKKLQSKISLNIPCFCLPEVKELNHPTMAEIAIGTGAKVLHKKSQVLDRSVTQSKVAAMQVEHFLNYLQDGDLIIVPGDRDDIVLATFLANLSRKYPFIAGLLFTGGMKPSENIFSLIEGADLPLLPMLVVDTDTQSAAMMVENIVPRITLDSKRKISLAIGLFNSYVDLNRLKAPLTLHEAKEMTPVRFSYFLYESARDTNVDILLPESQDERILRAVEIVLRRGICSITLLGDESKIKQKSSVLGLDLGKVRIINPETFTHKEDFAKKFYALRKHKGIILPMAREYMSRLNYFATMMLYEGYVDGLVSGATHTTRETIKPAFEIIKMQKNVKLISSIFFMLLQESVLVYGDCAVNPEPNAQQLAQIAVSSADSAKKFGIEPRVAMLSYSSGNSGIGEEVEKVYKATQLAKQMAPDLLIEGPMQYDAAIDPQVAARKMPNSKVAGRATVFIFPDLNTGNNTYKAVQRSAGAVAIGPILQGLTKPVNDLSRGCMVEDIVDTIAITAIQAKRDKR